MNKDVSIQETESEFQTGTAYDYCKLAASLVISENYSRDEAIQTVNSYIEDSQHCIQKPANEGISFEYCVDGQAIMSEYQFPQIKEGVEKKQVLALTNEFFQAGFFS